MNNQLNELVVYDDLSAIDMINKYIHDAPNGWLNKVRFNKCLVQFLYDRFPMLQDEFYTNGTRVYWLLNGLIEFPKCAYCGCELKNKNVYLAQGYPECCSNSHGQKLHFDSLSEEEQKKMTMRIVNWRDSKTEEELENIRYRWVQSQNGLQRVYVDWREGKTQDEIDAINANRSKTLKKWRANMPKDKEKQMLEKQKEYWSNMSDEDRQKLSEQRRKQAKEWWENASKEDIENRVKNQGIGIQKYFDNMTQQQKDEFKIRRKNERLKETEEHKRIRANKVSQTFKNKSDEEKAEIQRKSQSSRCKNFSKKNRIVIDGFVFDSKPEAYVYQTCKNLGYDIVPHPNTPIKFFFEGKAKYYYPDFNINGKIVEIKGDHFFRINGDTGKEEMFMPWKGKLTNEEYQYRCLLQEAKHQCMKENGVIIIKSSNVFSYNYDVLKIDENEQVVKYGSSQKISK